MTKKTVITTEIAIKLLEFCVNLATHQDPFFYDGRGKGYKSKKSMLEDAADLLNETDNEFSIYSDRQLRMLLTKCLKEAPESYENCVDKSTFDCFQAIGIVVMPSKEEILEKYGPNHNFNYQFHFSSFNDRAIPLIKRIINKRNNNDNNFDDSSETKKRKLDVVSDSTTTSVSFKKSCASVEDHDGELSECTELCNSYFDPENAAEDMSGNVESVVDPLIILETEKERTRQEELKLEQLKIRLELARMKNEFDLEIVE